MFLIKNNYVVYYSVATSCNLVLSRAIQTKGFRFRFNVTITQFPTDSSETGTQLFRLYTAKGDSVNFNFRRFLTIRRGSGSKSSDRSARAKMPLAAKNKQSACEIVIQLEKWLSSRRNSCPAGGIAIWPVKR